MKFRSLEISNLRAIKNLRLDGLNDLILIAGPNGVGKSCVLDGIRLLKSAYAGYQANELNNWFNEFQININRLDNLQKIFRDSSRPLRVAATIALSQNEIQYLRDNADALLRSLAWRTIDPGRHDPHAQRGVPITGELRAHEPAVEEMVGKARPEFDRLLTEREQVVELILNPNGKDQYYDNQVIEVLWSTFQPDHLGILDFHGAHRHYSYESVGSINFNIQDTSQRLREGALYQTQNKYNNVKSEMAAAYVRDIIADRAGASTGRSENIIETLKDLFLKFFPGKEFLGPVPSPDGHLSFPVKLNSDGSTHDVDFLSSGEKEVLFGYLRLRNSAPRNSVIMVDEPELHLNPRLVKGLPSFYHEHIGKALGNQVWLVTHSDAFLRDAKGINGASVWHMRELQDRDDQDNQAILVTRESDIERVVIDLVGDFAGYQPGARVLIVEGFDSVFDEELITRLFPEIASKLNIISAAARTRAEKLQELLERATQSVGWEARFFAITDRDIDLEDSAVQRTQINLMRWDVYHIENYLLEPFFIHKTLNALRITGSGLGTIDGVMTTLRNIAASKINEMVRIQLQREVHRKLQSALTVRVNGGVDNLGGSFANAAIQTARNVDELTRGALQEQRLRRRELELQRQYSNFLEDGSWICHFRGRDILQELVSSHTHLRYEDFRNLVVARMEESHYQPIGMYNKLKACLNL